MILRPVDLALIDLPENTLLLIEIRSVKSLGLPRFTIPVFVGVEVGSVVCSDSRNIDPRIVLCMAIGIDVTICLQSANISVPRVSLTIPPEFA